MKDKLLIIEDEPYLLDSLSKELTTIYTVTKAVNGNEGYEAAVKTKPDLILLDILLPQMSGEEFMVKLRKDSWGEKAKVIVITNLEDPAIEANLRRLGVLDYLVKSNFSIEMISQIILNRLHPDKSKYQGIAKFDTPLN